MFKHELSYRFESYEIIIFEYFLFMLFYEIMTLDAVLCIRWQVFNIAGDICAIAIIFCHIAVDIADITTNSVNIAANIANIALHVRR